MIDDCNINNLAKNQVSTVFNSRAIRRSVSSKLVHRLTLTETLIIPDITKTETNNCFIIHCFEENKDVFYI